MLWHLLITDLSHLVTLLDGASEQAELVYQQKFEALVRHHSNFRDTASILPAQQSSGRGCRPELDTLVSMFGGRKDLVALILWNQSPRAASTRLSTSRAGP